MFKACLSRINEKQELLRSLQSSIADRLLQPVAGTDVVVTQYVNILGVHKEFCDLVDIKAAVLPDISRFLM